MNRRTTVVSGLLTLLLVVGALAAQAAPVDRQIPFKRATLLDYPMTYTFRFSLWDSREMNDPGALEVWAEEATVEMTSGVISHYLGSVVPFDLGAGGLPVDFSQQLWVQVERVTPRGRRVMVGHRSRLKVAPYALFSDSVGTGGVTGEAITDGTVTAADLEDGTALTEIMDDDGAGSGLDADLLDGQHAAGFSPSGHNHDGSYSPLGHDHDADYSPLGHDHDATYVNEGQYNSVSTAMIVDGGVQAVDLFDGAALAEIADDDGAGSGLDADLLDGESSSAFAAAVHSHPDPRACRYLTDSDNPVVDPGCDIVQIVAERGDSLSAAAYCPAGYTIIGGGCGLWGGGQVQSSMPGVFGQHEWWCFSTTPAPTMKIFATCMRTRASW